VWPEGKLNVSSTGAPAAMLRIAWKGRGRTVPRFSIL
jgi:hypothetical protein